MKNYISTNSVNILGLYGITSNFSCQNQNYVNNKECCQNQDEFMNLISEDIFSSSFQGKRMYFFCGGGGGVNF